MAEENGTSKYVVQRRDPQGWWHDIATVNVPPRTKRRTILEKALGDADEQPRETDYRVVDEESARNIPVTLEPQEPRLKIG